MKCKNCNTENILKADYCKSCGNHFTREEKDAAYDKTIFGKIDKISDLWSKLKLENITGNRWFKVFSLAGLAVYCVIVMTINGRSMRILDSDMYEIDYAKRSGRYYLITEENTVGLNLYLPPKTEGVTVATVDENNYQIDRQEYMSDEGIVLTYTQDYHYIISSDKQQIELFVIIE